MPKKEEVRTLFMDLEELANFVPEASSSQPITTQGLQRREPIDGNLLLGKILQENGTPWILKEQIGKGGMADVYRAYPPKGSDLLPRAVKICQDTCDQHNQGIIETARLVNGFDKTIHQFPQIFGWGRLKGDNRIGDRQPAFMVLEELLPLPQRFLKSTTAFENHKGLHPNLALAITEQLLEYSVFLTKKGFAHGDLHPGQLMLRMSHLNPDEKVKEYAHHLCNYRFEVVVTDCDTITPLYQNIEHPPFSIGYGDPWFIDKENLSFKYTEQTDPYSIMATLYSLLTGKKILQYLEVPQGYSESQLGLWWKLEVEKRQVPTREDKERDYVFRPKDLYDSLEHSIGLQEPGTKKKSLFRNISKKFSRKKIDLAKQHEYVDRLVELISEGLKPLQQRQTSQSLLDLLRKSFPREEHSYTLVDPYTGDKITKTREIPVPFHHPTYHKQIE